MNDISTADARALLSYPVDPTDPAGWSRRRFLQLVGSGVLGGVALGSGGMLDGLFGEQAFAGAPLGPTDGILVTIVLYGGNDGLNTVVPYSDSRYYAQRGRLAIPASQVLALDGSFGLHPSLTFTRQLWTEGRLAIVHGSGYPNPDLSHFTSMGIWMNGRFGGGAPTTGWIGRWLDGLPAATADLAAATLGQSVPLHLVGAERRALAIPSWGKMFGVSAEAHDLRMYEGLRLMSASPAGRGPWHDMYARTLRAQLQLATDVAPAFRPEPQGDGLVRDLTVAARLINADLGLRVIDVGMGGFDNHDSQPWEHASLLTELDAGLRAFFATLSPAFVDRVTLLTLSEFGRTPFANGSNGTDHGTANVQFVIGSKVNGGHHGQHPSLALTSQWDRLQSTVDFRQVLGTVVDRWMGGGGSSIVNGNFSALDLFRAGPGSPGAVPTVPTVVLPPAAPCELVPLAPVRLFDTRDGTGGRLGALGAKEVWSPSLAGVSADAVAVALSVTAVDATLPTYVTSWPKGTAKPLAASLNVAPGSPASNLVVVRLGADGGASFYNHAGSVHLVGDLVGAFREGDTTGLTPLVPARLLDTRNGTGGRSTPFGPGDSFDLQVAGRGGTSAGCQAVALNVTVTGQTERSFLTLWPTGTPRPLAASLNMTPGRTMGNMVVARLGSGGKVSIYNKSGTTDLIVDVLGCFAEGAAGKFVPLPPARVLDTREGIGAPKKPVGQTPLKLALAGLKGVPAIGTAAVLLNLTAVQPTANTFVTVYPADSKRPTASNLNARAGAVTPNTVLARLGAGGEVLIFNNMGTVDLVADVMGYFTA